MANYNWLAYHSTGEILSATTMSPFLVLDDFQTLNFPTLSKTQMDSLVAAELDRAGIKVELEVDLTLYHYTLFPKKPIYLNVTAPLYSCNIDSGTFVKVQDSYTDMAISPSMYNRIREKANACITKVEEIQHQVFSELFLDHTIKDGKVALLDITEDVNNIPVGTFLQKYIPDDYLEIGSSPHILGEGRRTSLFIKKFDAQGEVLDLTIPSFLKGQVIGKGGSHIRYIAKQINARRINVV